MPRIDRIELLSGLLIIAIGAFFFFGAQEYRMGTFARMGPGFIPYWLGALSMTLGAIIVLTGIGRSSDLPRIAPRALLSVLGSIAVFGLLLERVGLVPAVFATTIVSMLGNRDARWPLILATATAIAALCWGIFIGLLGLPIPDFRLRF